MQNKLLTYLQINDIPTNPKFQEIGNLLIDQKFGKLISKNFYGHIFHYFDKLVKGEITQEDFFTLGDVTGNHGLFEHRGDLHTLQNIANEFTKHPDNFANTLIIVDNFADKYLHDTDNEQYKKLLIGLEQLNSKLIAVPSDK